MTTMLEKGLNLERPRLRRRRASSSLSADGEPMVWLTGGALIICLAMIVGLLLLILFYGMSTFWPRRVVRITTLDGNSYMGEITRDEAFRPDEDLLQGLPKETAERARSEMRENEGELKRRLFRTGNFQITQSHFQWVNDFLVKEEDLPKWAVVMERLEWGRFYGFPETFAFVAHYIESEDEQGKSKDLAEKTEEVSKLVTELSAKDGGEFQVLVRAWLDGVMKETLMPVDKMDSAAEIIGVVEVVRGPQKAWAAFSRYHDEVLKRRRKRRRLEKYDTGKGNHIQEEARLEVREAEIGLHDAQSEYGSSSPQHAAPQRELERAQTEYAKVRAWASDEFARIRRQIDGINKENGRYLILMRTAGEGDQPPRTKLMRIEEIVRAYPANQLSLGDKISIYLSRWWEYLTGEPREANSEGGVFPAIFGTVLMTLLLAFTVVPFGVLAALYLREYAKAGAVVSAVRIAVNNLAGVPSIVFGVFGLGFFCYGVGSFIDGGPTWKMPKPTWFFVLSATAVVSAIAFIAFFCSLTKPGQRSTIRETSLRYVSGTLWLFCTLSVLVLIATTPFFHGFYRAKLPNPTFGKGALIWSSLTLALLTLPVVIVATEEALSAVPSSMREGSYACGAGKWQTIRRIVLPRAMPGIMTGMILAMARGAGEVAPLMLVGAVKLAPKLPFDWGFPFGINRSFMHLGFHIYDVGFQSQNSEAAKPMVYTTALLLILLIAVLNITAIWLRARLQKRFVGGQF